MLSTFFSKFFSNRYFWFGDPGLLCILPTVASIGSSWLVKYRSKKQKTMLEF